MLLLALVLGAFAIGGTVSSPAGNALLRGTTWINVSFNGTANVTIEYNSTGGYALLRSAQWQNESHNFSWATGNGSFADGTYGLRINITNSTNASDATTLHVANLTIDNTPPNVTNLSASDRSLASTTTSVNLTVRITDLVGASTVQLDNGTATALMTLVSGTDQDGIYSAYLNLSDLSCQEEAICRLTVVADDDLGNSNSSIKTESLPLYVDSRAPVILANATNATSSTFGDNLTISALWQDVVLHDTDAFTVTFQILRAGSFGTHPNLASWSNSMLSSNYTNGTYLVNGSDEGRMLVFRVTLNDSNGNANTTANLTTTVGNVSPNVTLLSPANNTYIEQTDGLLLQFLDRGSGVNTSSITINLTGAVNTTINYSSNASLFDCSCASCGTSYNTTTHVENVTCELDVSWIAGNVTLRVNVSDDVDNAGSSLFTLIIVERPEIINITINGQQVTNGTDGTGIAVNMTNASREWNVSWIVNATTGINSTVLAFLNASPDGAQTFVVSPASALVNVTAGVNYLRINVTINNSALNDSFRINLTANVPLNLTSLSSQYRQGMVTAFNVSSGGSDITQTTDYINRTVDIIVNSSNGTNPTPFFATLNYTGRWGLSLRWNATMDAFSLTTGTAAERSELGNRTGSNVTVVLESAGQTELFFDERSYLVAVTVNVTNQTPYYHQRNGSTDEVYLLDECASDPAAPISASEACYSSGNATIAYLPRFERADRLFFGKPGDLAPNITIRTTGLLSQSVFNLSVLVVTPSPNATFCTYNLSLFNTSSNVSATDTSATVTASSFSPSGPGWLYETNLTGKPDGLYNLSVTCADSVGNTNTTRKNINLTDTTAPVVSGVSAGSIGSDEATISGSSDEVAIFTVKYGTSSSLGSSASGSSEYSTAASIEIESLSSGTRYFYNLTACDRKNNCGSSQTLNFTTATLSDGSGGGGGGGGGESTPTVVPGGAESTYTRVWFNVAAGQTIEYDVPDAALRTVRLAFGAASEKVTITIRQFSGQPAGVAAAAPHVVYKYLQVQHSGLAGADTHEVTFAVPRSWAQQVDLEGLALYRLEEDRWVAYAAERIDSSVDAYLFRSRLPGFSYFAIAAPALSSPAQAPLQDEIVPPAEEAPAPIEEQDTEYSDSGFVSTLDESSRGASPYLMIIAAVLLAVLGSAVGLQQYKAYQQRHQRHQEELRKEREQRVRSKQAEQSAAHDPMRPLYEYIVRMRAAGHPDERIRAKLLEAGWDEMVVDLELMRK